MSLSRFLQDRRGGVAPMFALAIIPVFGFVGAAVDYSRANSIKAEHAVGARRNLARDGEARPDADAEPSCRRKTNAYFQAMFNHAEAKNLVITPTYTTSGGSQLTVTASASMDTAFMKLMGYSSLDIGSSSTVKWGNSRLRVALVLDNTGSMADAGKMAAMQDRDQESADPAEERRDTNGDVYVSIIPFSKDVNVGASNYNQSYIRWDLWDADERERQRLLRQHLLQRHALDSERASFINGGSCSSPTSGICGLQRTHRSHTWNGCVTDRDQDYDTTNTAPSTGTRRPCSRPSSMTTARSS